MAERRKGRKKRDQDLKEGEIKPGKLEYAVAKYLRSKLPVKKTTLLSHKVEFFIASKAIDCLLESPWATNKNKTELHFTTRESVVAFLDGMLRQKFFHRAKKIVVQKDAKKKKKDKDEEAVASEEVKDKEKKHKEKKKKQDKEEICEKKEEKDEDEGEKKKEKKKIKLDMHLEQLFLDGNEAYVWIYDPIPLKAWIIGTLMVVGAVLICLFPLWPRIVRHYVYYLSVAAAAFLVFIIALAVIRLVAFFVIWVVTFGKHHLWLLPNLTEDVGFFQSFWPLYNYEYKGKEEAETDAKGKKKERATDSEEEGQLDPKKEESTSEQEGNSEDQEQTESDHESTRGVNDDNGFEIVDPKQDLSETTAAGDVKS